MLTLGLVIALLVFFVLLGSLGASRLSGVFLIFVVTGLFIFNRQNNDYQGYVEIFDNPELYAEIGYVTLVNGIKFLGGSHESVLLALGFLVAFTLLRLEAHSRLIFVALICYFIFPMPVDITQIRNTFALFLFINSLLELSKGRLLFSLLFVLSGVSFHYLGVVYLLIWFALLFRRFRLFNFAVLFSFVISLISVPILIKYFGDSPAVRTFSYYMADDPKYHSFFIWGIPVVIDILLIFLFFKRYEFRRNSGYQLIFIFESVIFISFAFLPGLLYVDEFNRLYRTMFILKYFLVALIIPLLDFKRACVLAFYALLSASILAFHYAALLDYDQVLFGM